MSSKALCCFLCAIIIFTFIQIVLSKSLAGGAAAYGCTSLDHAACDELCKTDAFWYGHCSAWDGTDFQCKCYDYNAPLDSKICLNYKDYCNILCGKKNQQGGYCFPAKSPIDTRGVPQCQCFKDITEFL